MAFYDGGQSMNCSLFVRHLFLYVTVKKLKDTFEFINVTFQCDARTALWFIRG